MELKVNVYDKKGEVKKTSFAKLVDIDFKTISTLFEIIKLEDAKTDTEVIRTIADAWDNLKPLVNDVFPDLTAAEIDSLKAKEVIPVLLVVIKESFNSILTIPTNPN